MERLNLRNIINRLKEDRKDAVKRDIYKTQTREEQNQKYDIVFVNRYLIVGGPLGGSITEYRERIPKEVKRGEKKGGGD